MMICRLIKEIAIDMQIIVGGLTILLLSLNIVNNFASSASFLSYQMLLMATGIGLFAVVIIVVSVIQSLMQRNK